MTRALLIRYSLVLTGATVLLMVLLWALQTFAGIEPPSGGLSAISPMIAAITCGQLFYATAGRLPEKGESWRYAAWFMIPNIVLSAILLAALAALSGGLGPLADPGLQRLMAWVAIIMLALLFLINRFFFAFGARQHAKAQSRSAKDRGIPK